MIAGFDIFSVIVVVFFALRVMSRGFFDELLSVGALVGGVIAAALFSASVSNIVGEFITQRIWSQIVSFLLVFVLVYVVVKIAHRFITNAVEMINLTNADRALGFFLGIIEGVAVLVVVILLLQVIPLLNEDKILAGSVVARLISPFVPTVLRILRS